MQMRVPKQNHCRMFSKTNIARLITPAFHTMPHEASLRGHEARSRARLLRLELTQQFKVQKPEKRPQPQ